MSAERKEIESELRWMKREIAAKRGSHNNREREEAEWCAAMLPDLQRWLADLQRQEHE